MYPATNGMEHWLVGDKMVKQDVAFHVNKLLARSADAPICINAAVEESTIQRRLTMGLTEQDHIVMNLMEPRDALVVSVGGNDLALAPSVSTMFWMGVISRLSHSAQCAPLHHFHDLLGNKVQKYIEQLTSKCKPQVVVPCSLYFPHELQTPCWASRVLKIIGYDSNPKHLQDIIRRIYEEATCSITIEGTRVEPLALFEVLDASHSSLDYCARVEPSAQGGRKMASAIVSVL